MKKSRHWIILGCTVLLLSLAFVVQAADPAASSQADPVTPGGDLPAPPAPAAAASSITLPIGLSQSPTVLIADPDNTTAIAWGDVDADGDLDLAVGNGGAILSSGAIRLYLNTGGVLGPTAAWVLATPSDARALAWGDVNGDGYLDLAVKNWPWNSYHRERVYLNLGGMLGNTAAWQADYYGEQSTSLAWGDMTGDGLPELAIGCRVFLNAAGVLQTAATWYVSACGGQSTAWGDMNGDGWLDLASSARGDSAVTKVYLNQGGTLSTTPSLTTTSGGAWSIAWGDVDGDGDLDLASGNDATYSGRNHLYLNSGGMLSVTPVWTSTEVEETHGVAWGDYDGDGDLDLAASGKTSTRLYTNVGGTLSPTSGVVLE